MLGRMPKNETLLLVKGKKKIVQNYFKVTEILGRRGDDDLLGGRLETAREGRRKERVIRKKEK